MPLRNPLELFDRNSGAKFLMSAPKPKQREVRSGSWSCKNALAIASTPRDVGDVAARGHFWHLVDFSVWKRF
jgi:hypothetical protein